MKKSDWNEILDITDLTAKRIISLTPSLTETLFALDLSHRLVGVTDSCDYPKEVNNWPHVDCWFDPNRGKMLALEPDLVLGLETAHSRLKSDLESEGIRVFLVNPITVEEAITDVTRIGNLLGARENARILTDSLNARIASMNVAVGSIADEKKPTVCRILDMEDERFHVAGPLSFQYDIISKAGGRNVTNSTKEAYPVITLRQLRYWNPDVIFSCGFDLNSIPSIANRQEWQSLDAVRSSRIFVFDCALTCRTGPRIVDMVELLFNTLFGK